MLGIVKDDDIIINSDADEVISEENLYGIANGSIKLPVKVNLMSYKYSFHWDEGTFFFMATAMTGRQAQTMLPGLRPLMHRKADTGLRLINGGWHLSSFGTLTQVTTKMRSIIEGYGRQMTDDETAARLHLGVALYDGWRGFTYRPDPPDKPTPRVFVTMPAYADSELMRWDRIGRGRGDTSWCIMLGWIDPRGYCAE